MSHQVYFPIARRGRAWRGMSWDWHWSGGMGEYWRDWQFVRIGIDWPEVELAPGVVAWPAKLVSFLQGAAGAGVGVLVSVKGCPAHWRTHGRACGFPDKLGGVEAFANLCGMAAKLPAVEAIEVWNEPDSAFGCMWQGVEQPWYGCLNAWGAGAYVALYDAAYKAVKAADGRVQVVLGSFMDVDDEYVEGCIRGVKMLDGVSFHFYCNDPVEGWADLQARRAWYEGLTGAPVWVTEMSLLDDAGGERQAEFARLAAGDGRRMYWYGDPGWRNGQGVSRYSELATAEGGRRAGYGVWASLAGWGG